jgi:transmembrane sensor
MKTLDRIRYLFEQYDQQVATPSETEELLQLVRDPAYDETIQDLFIKGVEDEKERELIRAEWDPVIQSILASLPGEEELVVSRFRWVKMLRWASVAAIVLVMTVGGWLLLGRGDAKPAGVPSVAERFKNDVQPGTNRPTLTLADGRQVILESEKESGSEVLATEGVVKVRRLENGQIIYDATAPATEVKYNTITNPRGSRVVSLTMADGSRVWLDAASSITYPTAFVGKERAVTMTGQAYFEVAHNAAKPFVVRKPDDGVAVQVLGTHFNVMAFGDEDVRVTLLEGSVEVARNPEASGAKKGNPEASGARVRIRPGEQAVMGHDEGDIAVVTGVDIEGTMAWKNGVFKFQDIKIEPLMKQLARWYDVEVVFEDKIDEHFVSTIPRDVAASEVFKILETTGRVHFRIEGKRITVTK